MNSVEWLTKLIAFDTISRNSNLALLKSLEEYFHSFNMPIRLTQNPKEPKANLFATLPDMNGGVQGGVILSGHTDVVPVDGQDWLSDPFIAVEKHNRIYGRGACDMKGFIAVMLSLVPEFSKSNLLKPVHFALSYDEEIGCLGAPFLIDDMIKANIKPDACIVGEPTNMQPVVAHKGIQVFRCRVHGHAVHSSLTTQGCNAIDFAAQLICFIRDLAEQIRREGPFDSHFDVPYTTVSTNMVRGGIAQNTIPELCEFVFEFRHLPNVKPQDIIERIKKHAHEVILPRMQAESQNAYIELDNIAAVPGFEASLDAAITELAMVIANEKEIRKVAYATEAGLFQNASIPTILCGPGSIEQAHRANEYVDIEQLTKCEGFLRKVIMG